MRLAILLWLVVVVNECVTMMYFYLLALTVKKAVCDEKTIKTPNHVIVSLCFYASHIFYGYLAISLIKISSNALISVLQKWFLFLSDFR